MMEYALMWLINDIIVYTPPIVILAILGAVFKKHIKRPNLPDKTDWLTIVPLFMSMYSLVTLASIVNHAIAEFFTSVFGTNGLNDVFSDVMPKSQSQWVIMLFFVGIIAPIAEEFIFRHMLLKPLRQLGERKAIIITAVLFGAFHGNLTQFLYAAVAGVILGIVAVRANSVKPAIAIHILNNSFDIGKSYLFELSEQVSASSDDLETMLMLFLLSGLLITIVLAVKGHFKIDLHGN
ncbi:MAG: CPBP family intramembrane metalloprotease [Oscillospiraceae bacterium]|nr:CPBP family intramembrane metalloprotease [Oscillospiraceae bacterium]